ncbi:MAG: hypothetical protein PWP67_779 [Clostridium butyricum]|nr:hypothetical protein [Thermoanaerobacterium sp.]MDK2827979.1 hypothetical protein [Clostridium butyricum]
MGHLINRKFEGGPKMIGDKNREVEKEIFNQIIGLSKSETV